MRVSLLLFALALAAVATLVAFGPEPGVTDAPGDSENATSMRLGAAIASAPEACSLCHYGWDVPFQFEGARDGDRYRFSLEPTDAYELLDVRATPVYEGSETLTAFRLPDEGEVALGGTTSHSIHLTEPAAAFRIDLVGERDYGRSELELVVETPDGRTLDSALPGPVDVVTVVPAPTGDYTIHVIYRDGREPTEAYALNYDLGTETFDVVPEAEMGRPAAFTYNLSEVPRGFLVQFRTYNLHPTDAWSLPVWGDLGFYTAWIDARTAWEPPEAPNWTAERIDPYWNGSDRQTIYEMEIDGTFVRHHDDRGEWQGRSLWRKTPGHEEPFPTVPPGTRELEVRIHAESANPATPPGDWYLSYARALRPSFHAPPADDVLDDGTRVYRLDVDPEEWETGEKGAWQWFPRLRFDENGNAAHDGPVRLTVIAHR